MGNIGRSQFSQILTNTCCNYSHLSGKEVLCLSDFHLRFPEEYWHWACRALVMKTDFWHMMLRNQPPQPWKIAISLVKHSGPDCRNRNVLHPWLSSYQSLRSNSGTRTQIQPSHDSNLYFLLTQQSLGPTCSHWVGGQADFTLNTDPRRAGRRWSCRQDCLLPNLETTPTGR